MNIEYESIPKYNVQILTGIKILEPVKYTITVMEISYLWIFTTKEYYINSPYMKLGPYKSVEKAMETLTKMKIGIRDIVLDV